MKKINYFLFVLSTILFVNVYSQTNRVNYERDTKWNFGVNVGATWTEKELDFINKPGFSGGLTLGRSIYEKEGRTLSFDLRGRLLWGQTQSWSPTPIYDSVLFQNNSGLVYRNYKLEYTEGSLELVVNAHRLRERTGILLYGFGGVGWVSHSVRHNYKNGNTSYDYSVVDSTASSAAIVENLSSSFNDYSWETDNEFFTGRKTLVMPSLGVGLGYQLTPKLSVGVEHKVTFGLNDQLDGNLDGVNDRLHYTNFNIRWNLFKGERGNGRPYVPGQRPIGNGSSNNDIGDYTTPNTGSPEGSKPLVNITNPSKNDGSVFNSNYNIIVKVYYVGSKNDIYLRLNGVSTDDFVYNSSTKELRANINLVTGTNTIIVGATNDYGSDMDTKTINYEEVCDKPSITFIRPSTNGGIIATPNTRIEAKILNVASRNDIKFRFNGVLNNQFSYNTSTGAFIANVICVEGNNNFHIDAQNQCGFKDASKAIVFNEPLTGKSPVVSFTTPISSPFTTNNSQITIGATVLNVNNRSNIQYKINGVVSSNFSFNNSTKSFSASVNLQPGNTIVEIRGVNNFGADSKSTVIIRSQQQQPQPVVVINTPSINPFSVTSNSSFVDASVYNVLSKNQIQVYINGVSTNNFTFNSNTKKINFTANLVAGTNNITISGSNNSGTDTKSTKIVYKKIVMSPPLVTFTSPASSPYSSNRSNIIIKARVLNVSSPNQIQVLKNGVNMQGFSYSLVSKELVLNTNLINGSNSFVIKATNQSGVDAKTSIINLKREITQLPPVVTIQSPTSNPFNTTSANLPFKARVSNINNKSQISLVFNGASTQNFQYNSLSKELTFSTALNIGSNTLKIVASNNAGIDSESIIVNRSNPCLKPVLNYQIPASSPHNHVGRNGNMAFTFSSSNLNSVNQINVKNNGYDIPVNLESSNGNIWGTVPLVVGANTLIVTAKNDCGETKRTLSLLYKGEISKQDPPVITMQSPNRFPFSTNSSSLVVTGKIINISSRNNVQVTMDGNNIPFTYSTSSKEISIPTTLSVGSHQIRVKARNNYGTDTEAFDLIRIGVPPSVRYTNLGSRNSYRSPYVSPGKSFTVKGKISNFQGVTFNAYVDGNRISNYSYNSRTGAFSIPISFSIQGQGTTRRRTVKVKVSNSAGVDSKEAYVTYIVQSIGTKPNAGTISKPSTTISSSSQVYKTNIKKADEFFNKGNLDQAKLYYQKASKALPKEGYPKQKLTEINKKIKAKALKSKTLSPRLNKPSQRVNPNKGLAPIAKP